MSNPSLTAILEDLAAGRITPDEAARRIDEANGTSREATSSEAISSEPSQGSQSEPERPADSGGRPQYATHSREDFRAPTSVTHDDSDAFTAEPPSSSSDSHTSNDSHTSDDSQKTSSSSSSSSSTTARSTYLPPPDKASVNGVDRVSIRAVGRRVRVLGDTRISTVSVDGPHVLRRNGSVLEVASEGEAGPSLDGFSFIKPPRNLEDIRALGLGKELVIRMNPKLVADIEVTAGSLHAENVPWLGKVRVTAGAARVTGMAEASDLLVQAGQGTLEGAVTTGRSRVRCESGSLVIKLADESNVTVTSESQLGRVVWTGGHSGAGDEVVMGNGNARLDVGVVMGHAQVRVGGGAEEA